MGITYQIVYSEVKSEGLLWPLSKDSHTEKRFIDHMVVVESSEELEEMIENDVMEELERRVRNRINEMQRVWRVVIRRLRIDITGGQGVNNN